MPAGQTQFLTAVVSDRIYTTSQRTMHPGPSDCDIGLILPQLKVSPLEERRWFVCVSLKEASETVASPSLGTKGNQEVFTLVWIRCVLQ